MKPDFSGYATKAGVECSDGRTIMPNAFKPNSDPWKVPLLWHHLKNDPENVLGYALLENRPDGVYARGFFNNTAKAVAVKESLRHGDYDSMSIFANKLVQKGGEVHHGMIHEVSLVLAGANPEARVENIMLQHSDGTMQELETEAEIFSGEKLEHIDGLVEHADDSDADDSSDSDSDDISVEDFLDSLDDSTRQGVEALVGKAFQDGRESASSEKVEHAQKIEDDEEDAEDEEDLDEDTSDSDEDSDDSDDDSDDNSDDDEDKKNKSSDSAQHSDSHDQEDNVKHTVFDQGSNGGNELKHQQLTHDQLAELTQKSLATMKEPGWTFGKAIIKHAQEYGIENVDYLFPDHKAISNTPEFLSRQMEWVQVVMGGVKNVPWARIKTLVADITAEEARAKGYVKGSLKKEEIIRLLKRTTDPTTIYKKQKLDRDDILDITDLDVVAWLKAEMRLMLNEEIARAILLGDGREFDHEDKVDEDKIRPIANDDPMYAHQVTIASDATPEQAEEAIIRAHSAYRGSGSPVLFTTVDFLTDLLLRKDAMGRRIYSTQDEVAATLRVSRIVEVEPMSEYVGLVGIIVNLTDYAVGANAGGQVTTFEDFDIDFNQNKYLAETRISGALIKPKAALVIRKAAGTEVTPTSPSFDGETNTITIPTIAGVIYSIDGETVTGDVVITSNTDVEARAAQGYQFPSGATTSWNFDYSGE